MNLKNNIIILPIQKKDNPFEIPKNKNPIWNGLNICIKFIVGSPYIINTSVLSALIASEKYSNPFNTWFLSNLIFGKALLKFVLFHQYQL